MQMDADVGEAAVAVRKHTGFGTCQNPLFEQVGQVGRQALRLRYPKQGVDVAQTARTAFDIRLQHRPRTLRFGVAVFHLHQFCFDKCRYIALHVHFFRQFVCCLAVAKQKPSL